MKVCQEDVSARGGLRKILALLVCLAFLPIGMLPTLAWATGEAEVLAASGSVCSVRGIGYESLDLALASAVSGDTITLLCSFDHFKTVSLEEKSVTIATNGYVLNVDPQQGDAFFVRNGTLSLDDSAGGSLNAVCTNDSSYGAVTQNASSHITLSSVSSPAGIIVYGGTITVKGDVIRHAAMNSGSAVMAYNSGIAYVRGDVISASYGIDIHGYGSKVYVQGDVIAQDRYAVRVSSVTVSALSDDHLVDDLDISAVIEQTKSEPVTQDASIQPMAALDYPLIEVLGNVTCASTVQNTYAVYTEGHSLVNVVGNVVSYGGLAVFNNWNGNVTVGGNCTGISYGIVNIGGFVTVGSDVSGNCAVSSTRSGAAVTVHGNVYGTELGIEVQQGSSAFVDGQIKVSSGGSYILIDDLVRGIEDYEVNSQVQGYREYANVASSSFRSYVWVVVPVAGAPGSGDLNGDGVATMDEAIIVIRIVCGVGMTLNAQQFAAVDMDRDGLITMADVMLIVRKACGL
jgi:hypothetical protein